jgi:hypothetical protein
MSIQHQHRCQMDVCDVHLTSMLMLNGLIKCPFETNMDVERTYVMSIQH